MKYKITFANVDTVTIISTYINSDKIYINKYFKETKESVENNNLDIDSASFYDDYENRVFIYKQIRKISKKQCIEWIRDCLCLYGVQYEVNDNNCFDECRELAEQLVEKYNL